MRQLSAILLLTLLAISWFSNVFSVRLVEEVIVEHRLSEREKSISDKVVKDLGLSQTTQLKSTDIEHALSLGYAAPFVISHNIDGKTEHFEVLTDDIELVEQAKEVLLADLSDLEKDKVEVILSHIIDHYISFSLEEHNSENVVLRDIENGTYNMCYYISYLDIASPPPKA
ncbi:hypothetical protein [Fulvivirga lutimaris]|uniref:hypothetical protein n=1 Tax=Fulvivirga lutimaris TaxID=1819566 RepID=UPI0012BCB5D4|nr:hypothetical protein [Fulvivirga lutimaris]MTI38235.1 hypothetical protein [Fulvivirga lutimaris]